MRIYAPLTRIQDNRFQRRSLYAEIEELAHSIQSRLHTHRPTLGLLQVPRGRLVDGEGRPVAFGQFSAGQLQAGNFLEVSGLWLELSIGHRRKRAFDWLAGNGDAAYGAAVLPVELADIDDTSQLDDVFEENYRRGNIAAADFGELIVLKKQQLGAKATDADVAAAWQIGRSTVTKMRLLLERLPDFVLAANRDGRLSAEMAQRLIKVADIEQVTRSRRIAWSKAAAPQSYGSPIHPLAFCQWVIEKPDEASPAAVENYVSEAMRHVGRPIPETVATMAMGEGSFVQSKCKGCPARLEGVCVDWECLKAKKLAYGRWVAETYAAQMGWSFSDNENDFEATNSFGDARTVYQHFLAGGCQHMVIGWRPEGGGPRPEGGYQWVSGDAAFRSGSKAGLILGHRGPLARCVSSVKARREPPPKSLREKWEKTGNAKIKVLAGEGKRVTAERLAALGEEVLRPLAALSKKPPLAGDAASLASVITDAMWQSSSLFGDYSAPLQNWRRLSAWLATTGVEPFATAEEQLEAEAEWALQFHYEWGRGRQTEAQEALTAVDGRMRGMLVSAGFLPAALNALWEMVRDALADLADLTEKEGE